MSRKRSKVIKLTVLSAASLLVGGCGGCDDDKAKNFGAGGDFAPQIDTKLAKQAVAAGTSAVVSDAFLQGLGMLAAGPLQGLAAPVQAAHVGLTIDMADETASVTAHESGLGGVASNQPNSTSPHSSTHRRTYHYHSSPGIGWFLWGHYLGSRSTMAGQPYTPPRNYGQQPRQFAPRPSGGGSTGRSGSSFAGGSSSGRSGSSSTTGSGGVSRGGFGSSGSAHASGGSS